MQRKEQLIPPRCKLPESAVEKVNFEMGWEARIKSSPGRLSKFISPLLELFINIRECEIHYHSQLPFNCL
jgi:hypothetical protein